MKKIYLFFFLFLSTMVFGQQNVLIPQKDIEINLICGYANAIDQKNHIAPITVNIKNNTTKIAKGTLRVVQPLIHQIGQEDRYYEQTVVLSGKSNKVIKFYMLLRSENYRLNVFFIQEDGAAEPETFDLKVEDMSLPFWVHWKSKIEKIKLSKNKDHFFIESATITFPEHNLFLNNVYVMSVDNPSDFVLTPQQTNIFKNWLSRGGIFIAFNTVGLEALLRKELDFIPDLSFPATGYSNTSTSLKDALSVTNFGLGKVLCFYNSRDNEHIKKFFSNDFFVKEMLFQHEPLKKQDDYYYYNYNQRSDATTQKLKDKLVGKIDLGWMVLLLLGYLVCIGPVDYFLTKLFKKRMLTWVIYIVSIITFSFLAYAKGYILKSGPMKVESYNFVEINADKEMTGVSLFGIYSTRNTTYDIKSNMSRNIFLPLNESTSSYETFQSISSQSILKTRIPIYSAKNYACAWSHHIEQTKEIAISRTGLEDIYITVPANMKITKGRLLTERNDYELQWRNNKLVTLKERALREFNPAGSLENYFLFFSTRTTDHQKAYLKDTIGSNLSLTNNLKDYALVILFVETDEKFIDILGENAVHNTNTVLRYVLPLNKTE